MSLFHKRKLVSSIEGCRPSLHNGQLQVSTGNTSLDHILGGGLPLGSILLIEEDKYTSYAKVLSRYFLSEGVYRNHSIFLATKEDSPEDFIRKLPGAVEESVEKSSVKCDEEMRIAWRYNDLPKVSLEQGSKKDYHFDLSKVISEEDTKSCDITTWNMDGDFSSLQDALTEKMAQKCFKLTDDENEQKKLLRICINSLGSPLWWCPDNFHEKLLTFLTLLKSITRNSCAVCLLTIPSHLFHCLKADLLVRVRNLVDYVVEIESFSGAETNVMYKEYHGLLHIHRIAAFGTLAPSRPETFDLAFKLRRKKFVVEKLHLPPDIAELSDTLVHRPSLACASGAGGGGTHSLLDF
ncbi:Putative elongator complex protein 4 [Sergentomyia squamirostris]